MAEARAPLYLSIDFGTSVTVAAGMRAGGEPEVIGLDGDDPHGVYMPSAVYRAQDGEIRVGRAAVDAIGTDPLGGQLTPKLAIRAGMEVEMLSQRPVPLVALIARVLARAHDAAIAQFDGDVPAAVVLTCPVAWAPDGPHAVRRRVLRAATQLAAIPGAIHLMNEAEAAAHHQGDGELPIAEGELCSIYDIGGGTCDIAVLRRDQGRLTVIALGDAEVGGDLFDWRLYEHVLDALERSDPDAASALQLADDPVWRLRQVALAAAVRSAKEHLSEFEQASIAYPEGIAADPVIVTRERFEALIHDDVVATGDELSSCIRRGLEGAGDHRGLRASYIVGGASRTPLVQAVVQAAAGNAAECAEEPRAAVALGAVLALEARAGARPRRRIPHDEELHARNLLACAAYQRYVFLAHIDASGAPKLTRIDLRRGAADRSIDLPSSSDGELAVAVQGGGVAVSQANTLIVRDLELQPVLELRPGADLPGAIVWVEVGPTCVWVVYAESQTGQRDRRALRLRTIGVPSAEREQAVVRDVAVAEHHIAPSSGGPPGFWAVGSGVPGRHELLFALPMRGVRGTEQGIFAAAEDGRMRKVQSRSAPPWLIDRRLTPGGELWLEADPAGNPPRLHAHLGDAHLITIDGKGPARVDAIPLVTPGALYLAVGSSAGPPWELLQVDVARRTESDRQLAGIFRQAAVEPPWHASHQRGLFAAHRDAETVLATERRAVSAENGVWLGVRGPRGTGVLRVDALGVRARVDVPDGAVAVGSGAGRLYVRTPAAELRSLAWEHRAGA